MGSGDYPTYQGGYPYTTGGNSVRILPATTSIDTGTSAAIHIHSYVNGMCIVCGAYMLNGPPTFGPQIGVPDPMEALRKLMEIFVQGPAQTKVEPEIEKIEMQIEAADAKAVAERLKKHAKIEAQREKMVEENIEKLRIHHQGKPGFQDSHKAVESGPGIAKLKLNPPRPVPDFSTWVDERDLLPDAG